MAMISPWGAMARPRIFWIGVAAWAVAAFLNYRLSGLIDLFGFLLISGSAFLPVFLWCSRRLHGLPIFPIFSLGTIGTFAFPLIAGHPLVAEYSGSEKLSATVVIAATNFCGTAACYLASCHIPRPRSSHWEFRSSLGELPFFIGILFALFFNILSNAYLGAMDPSLVSLLRAIIIALSNLSIFILGYQAGARTLRRPFRILYGILLFFLILSSLPSVLLVNALSYGALAVIGFALGRGRVPWLALILLLGGALYLQAGKAAIREKYWFPLDSTPVTMSRYPQFISDWISFSWTEISTPSIPLASSPSSPDGNQSFLERASLMQLFLQVQRMSPGQVPYLHGETYAIIPGLLLPRFLVADKARSHLGTYMLAIHYDLQRPEDTFTTTIGFGLINEALANFGYAGCLALGAGLGLFYGFAARWSALYPLLSLRTLFSILVLTVSFQNEFTAGVFVTTLFQGTCALILFAAFTMGRVTHSSWTPSFNRYLRSIHPLAA